MTTQDKLRELRDALQSVTMHEKDQFMLDNIVRQIEITLGDKND